MKTVYVRLKTYLKKISPKKFTIWYVQFVSVSFILTYLLGHTFPIVTYFVQIPLFGVLVLRRSIEDNWFN